MSVLRAADHGNWSEVVRRMRQNVYIHPRDARGHRMRPVRSRGLENRRREEVVPFLEG